jgi:hypothetical protein
MSLQERIPHELAARLEGNPFRRQNRYVRWNGQSILAETVCKRCGRTLTALGPDPRFTPQRRELKGTKERTIVLETLVARLRTADFDTIEFEVEEPAEVFVPEGDETQDAQAPRLGLHRTAICTPCKKQLLDGVNDISEVQQLYDADLERMAIEDEANCLPVAHTRAVLARLATRKVRCIAS